MEIASGGGAVMITLAELALVQSACDTAVTLTVDGLGTTAGALYTTDLQTTPKLEFPPVAPLTCHVTAVLFVFCTVAVNCWLCPAWTEAKVGEMEIATGGGAVM